MNPKASLPPTVRGRWPFRVRRGSHRVGRRPNGVASSVTAAAAAVAVTVTVVPIVAVGLVGGASWKRFGPSASSGRLPVLPWPEPIVPRTALLPGGVTCVAQPPTAA